MYYKVYYWSLAFVDDFGVIKCKDEDENEEIEVAGEDREEEDDKEEISKIKNDSRAAKKDIFRPYNLPDPDIKPLASSYNVSNNQFDT